ncbi:hypothetical protein FDG09_10140 [Clostridium sporogenes]|uniref:DUF6602 domain-containing protein n=1 Tax=Clostridium sporogenes TaxID=1509 RepID=UPI0013D660AB|nr:DUF6602 domain-containing protein [Clostridium sporogenes]EKS4343917.1 hypothetical protein [Clostridium botulinum]EKS4396195.1 hypothetical protein [Clostridium botulinum]NFV13278.1 hypothetical protein [Clostridium sporogenes]
MIDRNSNKRLYVELLRGNFEKILTELDLVYNLTHNGEKGKEAEEILKNFLKKYLPKKYEVTTGFVHTDLGTSNQCDILLYDSINYAPLYHGYANEIIHMSSLRGVIECTMRLNNRKIEIDNEKIGNLKRLYRNDASMAESMSKEPVSILFAYKSEGNILESLSKLEKKNFDIVFCADGKLYILDKEKSIYCNNVVDNIYYGETEHGYVFTKEQHAFSLFYSCMIDFLNRVTSNPDKYNMVQEYSTSSIYVDYKGMHE